MSSYTIVDLFSGAGGLSLGFKQAGFFNVLSIESDEAISKTYNFNFPENKLINSDIRELSNSYIKELLIEQKVDVVVGGPPCQGFSLAGKIGRSFIEDERNTLFKEFFRVVQLVNPKVFVMENVARLAIHNNGKTLEEIINHFENLGYEISYKILQASDYGVPQKRSRIFIVGSKIGKFSFPDKTDELVSVKDAIDDLPPLRNGEKSNIPNHFSMNHSKQMLEKMSYVKDGGTREDIPNELRPKSGDARKYIRYKSNEPSVTVTGDMRKIFHYNQNRALSPRELARLQSFPDDFIFVGNSICVQQQIGNAVPPKLAKFVALAVKSLLESNE